MLFLSMDVYVGLTGFILQNKERRDHSPREKGKLTPPHACPELWPMRTRAPGSWVGGGRGQGRGCLPDPSAVSGKCSALTLSDAGDERAGIRRHIRLAVPDSRPP